MSSQAKEDGKCLGVIIPAFNEEPTVKQTLERVLCQPCVFEVVVVDDGSVDRTAALVRAQASSDSRIRLVQHPANRGKGASIRTGLAATSAPFVIIQDADAEYDPADYSRLLQPLLCDEADVVYGSRFLPDAKPRTTFWHKLQNECLTWFANAVTGLNLTDEATCYKLFRREVLEGLSLEENRFGFCPEVTVKICRKKIRLVEVPISYSARSRNKGKKLRFRDGLNAIRSLLKYRFFDGKVAHKRSGGIARGSRHST